MSRSDPSTRQQRKPQTPPERAGVRRISVSLPEQVYRDLGALVADRGLENRSKAIAEMITQAVVENQEDGGDRIMAGTITLVYDEARGNLLQRLAELERTHVDEVISSLHVQLEGSFRMEVLLVQGPATQLKRIADRLTGCTGVRSGRLTLTPMILPPVHPLPK